MGGALRFDRLAGSFLKRRAQEEQREPKRMHSLCSSASLRFPKKLPESFTFQAFVANESSPLNAVVAFTERCEKLRFGLGANLFRLQKAEAALQHSKESGSSASALQNRNEKSPATFACCWASFLSKNNLVADRTVYSTVRIRNWYLALRSQDHVHDHFTHVTTSEAISLERR